MTVVEKVPQKSHGSSHPVVRSRRKKLVSSSEALSEALSLAAELQKHGKT
jgi:hypothetical protein